MTSMINDETLRAYYHYYLKYSWIDDKDFLIYARIIMALRLSTSTRQHPEDTAQYVTLLNELFKTV